VKGRVIESCERFGGIVPLIENQGDVLTALGQLAVALAKFLSDGLEDGRIGEIARIDLVEDEECGNRCSPTCPG
jgi:hypothetical protein